jgi:hypothetical protein
MGIAGFNRLCSLVGLVILFAATAFYQLREPFFGDFVQFQMAGLVDRAGAWDALYPVPIPGSVHNAGSNEDSIAKPLANEIAASHGIDCVSFNFILPPPAALLFWPLGFCNGHIAHRLWLLASVFAGWATAVQAGLILQRCAGRKTRWAGVIALIIAAMPAMRQAVLVANLTPFISASIGLAILSLMDERSEFESAAMIVLGTVLKYAGAVLMPIALIQRRWRTIGWAAALSAGWCAITLCIMGTGPFIEFVTHIAPTLVRSHEMADNISLTGVLLHALHQLPPLPSQIMSVISIARLLVLAAILPPMIRIGRDGMRQPAAVCAAAMSLLAWLLFFSPVAWSHYLIYLCPLWGWVACPTEKITWRTGVAWFAMTLVILSPDQMPSPPAFDTWGARLLVSLGLMLGLGISGLYVLAFSTLARDGRPRSSVRSATRSFDPGLPATAKVVGA